MAADPNLPKQCGSARLESDSQCDSGQDRRQREQGDGRDRPIEGALEESFEATEVRLFDMQKWQPGDRLNM